MDCRLIIQNQKKDWVELDLPLSFPRVTYQVNDLSDLENRNGDYSQSISLPKTASNMKAFGFGPLIGVESDTPYRRHPALLYFSGVLVMGKGTVLTIKSVNESSINAQIVGNSIDLAKNLSKSTVTEESQGFWRSFDMANVPLSGQGVLSNGVRVAYSFATLFNGDLAEIQSPGPSFMSDIAHLIPCLNLYDVVKWVLGQQGLMIDTDVKTTDTDSIYVPCMAIKNILPQTFLSEARGVRTITEYGNFPIRWSASHSSDSRTGVWGMSSNRETLTYTPQSPENLSMDISLTGVTVPASQFGVLMVTKKSTSGGTEVLANLQIGGSSSSPSEITRTISTDLEPGEVLTITGYGSNSSSIALKLDCYIDFTGDAPGQESPQALYPTQRIDMLESLGFETQSDIVKAFLQLFGLTLSIKDNTVVFRTFNYLRENEGNAVDWSKKLVNPRRTEIEYLNNEYAQTNLIKTTDNEANNITDSTVFIIPDENLDPEKTIFTIKLMPLGKMRYDAGDYVNYPMFSLSGDEGPALEVPEAPGIIRISEETENHQYVQGSSSKTFALPLSSNIKLDEIIPPYYNFLFDRILGHYKKIKASFVLSPQDIQQLDFFRPVYLSEFRSFFYIEKISNYNPYRPTEVNLIKI